MEDICDIVLESGSPAAESIHALMSMKAQSARPETASKVFVDGSYFTYHGVDEFRALLTIQLRNWVEHKNQPSQRHFWRFFDNVRDYVSAPCEDGRLKFVTAHELAHWVLDGTQRSSVSRSSQRSLEKVWPVAVIDGQRRLAAVKANRDLSGRAIRSALETALKELSNFDDANTVCQVLEVLDGSLAQEVSKRIRWLDAPRSIEPAGSTPPSTREWVLGFLVRTGNPPPGTGLSRPAHGWAIVIITEARREDYATIQGQEVSRNLRYTICEQRPRTRFNRGTQNYANHSGSWQPAGYRSPLHHHSLAQCA